MIDRHTRSGVHGRSSAVTPNGASASSTALRTAAGVATMPSSPTPLAPSGFTAAGAPVRYMDAPDFAAFFAEDSARLVRAVQRIGRVE